MESEDKVKKAQTIRARARNISHHVRCTECGSRSIEDSQADYCHSSQEAVMTAFFPCVTFGQIAEILDEGQTSCTLGSFMHGLLLPVLACSILGTSYRQKLRLKYNLVRAPAEDCNVHLFCPCCALCQEYRELKNRGIDPSKGWMGYLAEQQEANMVPPVVHSMIN